MSDDEWRGVLVLGEIQDGELRSCTLELLAKARDLTDQLGGRLTCVLVGEDAEALGEDAVHHGADRVLAADAEHDGFQASPLVGPLSRIVTDVRPEIVLLSATDLGRDLGPMLGGRLDTGVANECVDLDFDVSERLLLAKRHVFGGQLEETVVTPSDVPQIASLQPGAAREGFPDETRFGDVETIDVTLDEAPSVEARSEGPRPGLDSADVVVVGGRQVPADAWEAVEELAEALGAAVGATRGAVHGDRADEEHLVDATAREVSPRLYVGVGVRGTFDHVAAIDPEWTVSVTRDEEAPIAELADWALVGEPAEVAREIAAKARAE